MRASTNDVAVFRSLGVTQEGTADGWAVYTREFSTFFAERGHGAMYGQNGKLLRCGQLLAQGQSIGSAARMTGMSKHTARKLHRILCAHRIRQGKADLLCGCGRPSVHQGWCRTRFKDSPKRRQVMAKIHARQRENSMETDSGLIESLVIDGNVIVDDVRRLQRVKDPKEAVHWLEKIEEMTKAMRWYIKRAAPTEGGTV